MRCSGRASCSIRTEERPPLPDPADARLRRFLQAIQPIAFLQDAPSRPCRDVAEIIPRSGKQLPRLADCVTNIGRSHLRNSSCGDQLCIDRVDDPVPGIRTTIGKKDDCLASTPLTVGRLDDPLHHQAGNEGDVSGEAIELGHDDRAFGLAGQGEGGRQLRASIEGVRSLAGFDLGELLDDRNALGLGKAGDRGSLCLDAQT